MPSRDKYTDPELRDEVKEEIHASDKGGRPGQWSARKAQLMASEYKKRGGSYTTDKETGQDESQKHLSKWTEEEWQTKEGDANATKEDDGTKKRYLPKKAWENMSEKEKEETEKKKEEGGKEGKQYVGNTGKAKEERRKASKDIEGEGEGEEEEEDGGQESKGKKNGTSTAARKGQEPGRKSKNMERKERESEQEGEDEDGDHAEEDGVDDDGEEEDGDFVQDAEANQADEEEYENNGDGNEDEPHGQKRVHTRQDDKIENKKQKTNGEENGENE